MRPPVCKYCGRAVCRPWFSSVLFENHFSTELSSWILSFDKALERIGLSRQGYFAIRSDDGRKFTVFIDQGTGHIPYSGLCLDGIPGLRTSYRWCLDVKEALSGLSAKEGAYSCNEGDVLGKIVRDSWEVEEDFQLVDA